MVVFTALNLFITAFRLAGNVSRLVWTPERLAMMGDVERILREGGRPGYAEFVRKDMRNQRWIQEQAYNTPMEALSAIAGAAVAVRGFQLGLPLTERLGRMIGTRTLVRRWDELGQSVHRLLTGNFDVQGDVDLVTRGQGLSYDGWTLAEDVWGIAHGVPLSPQRAVTLGQRMIGLATGILEWAGLVQERLPDQPEPPRPHVIGDPSRRGLQNYMSFVRGVVAPSEPPPTVRGLPSRTYDPTIAEEHAYLRRLQEAQARPPTTYTPPSVHTWISGVSGRRQPARRMDRRLRMGRRMAGVPPWWITEELKKRA